MTSRSAAERLLAKLARIIGTRAAEQELRWIKAHARQNSAATLEGMVDRRLTGEPLQYILGTQPFGPLDLLVRPPVLIPRPETEHWSLRLARQIRPSPQPQAPLKLLDLCTGTACIPLLLCHTWPSASVSALGVDIASEAIDLAKENAERVGIAGNTFSVLQADLLQDTFPETLRELGWSPVDVLTSNPPYIPLHEYKTLSPSVKDYEDPRALLGDPNPETSSSDGQGLTFYRAIAELVHSGLVKPGGVIALEVGHDQSAAVQELMHTRGGVRSTEVWKDPWGVLRTVVCRK